MPIRPLKIKILGIDLFGKELAKVNNKIGKASKKISGVGRKLSLGLSVPLAGAGFAAVKMSTDFNEAMANVGTLIPGNQKRLEELKKGVQELAVETGKSTDDIARGLFQVISAFGDGPETLDKLRTNARGAVGGVAEVADAINLTSLVTKNYGDTSDAATKKVLNLAFMANKLGQTTFPEMAASMGATIPIARTLGVTQEELFGVMGTFTGVTGNTSEVVTQLRSVLGALIKPTADMEIAFKKLGVKSGEELIRTKGLQGAIQSLVDITKPYPGVLGKVLGRKEALTIALAAAGESAETFTQKTAAMNKVTGAAEEAFGEQTKGINKAGFAMKQATQRLVVLGQKFGDAVAPMLIKVTKLLSPLIEKFSNLSPRTQKIIFVLGALVSAIGPLLIILGALSAAIAAISLPVVLITGGIALLGAGVALLIIKWKSIIRFFKKTPDAMVGVLKKSEFLVSVGEKISEIWGKVVSVFKDIFGIVGKVTKSFSKLIGTGVGKIFNALGIGGGEGDRVGSKLSDRNLPGSDIDQMLRSAFKSGGDQQSQVEVKFNNAPPGTEIRTTKDAGNLDVLRGLQTAG